MGKNDGTDDERQPNRDKRTGEKAWEQAARGVTPIEQTFFGGLNRPPATVDERESTDDDGLGR